MNKKFIPYFFILIFIVLFIRCGKVGFFNVVGKNMESKNIEQSKRNNVFVCEYKASINKNILVNEKRYDFGDIWVEYPWMYENLDGDIEISKHWYDLYINTFNSETKQEEEPQFSESDGSGKTYTYYFVMKNGKKIATSNRGTVTGKLTTGFSTNKFITPPDTIVLECSAKYNDEITTIFLTKSSNGL